MITEPAEESLESRVWLPLIINGTYKDFYLLSYNVHLYQWISSCVHTIQGHAHLYNIVHTVSHNQQTLWHRRAAVALWKNSSFNECVLWENSGACVHTKSRGIKATCIISGDRGQPCVSLCSQCDQQKPWWRPANEAKVILCVHIYRHNWWWN